MRIAVLFLLIAGAAGGCRTGSPGAGPRGAWLMLSRESSPRRSNQAAWVAVAANGSVTAGRWATAVPPTPLDTTTLARFRELATAAATDIDYLNCRSPHAEYHYVLTVISTYGPLKWAIAPGPGCLDDAPPSLRSLVVALDRLGHGQAAF